MPEQTPNTQNLRWNDTFVQLRLEREINRNCRPLSCKATKICNIAVPVLCLLSASIIGIRKRGLRNALAIKTIEREIKLARLPKAFDGFRIMHISDTHANLDTAITDTLIDSIKDLDYDVIFHTGDFHDRRIINYELAVNELKRLTEHFKSPAYGVFGNHDYLEMAAPIESTGVKLLLNENIVFERGQSRIYIAGVDDASDLGTHDVAKAAKGIPQGANSLLLSHDPVVYIEAESNGFQALFSGHTHGGQICLPGGKSIIYNTHSPNRMNSDAWSYKDLQGFTSRGVGCSGTMIRYNCPPEIVIHTLRQA